MRQLIRTRLRRAAVSIPLSIVMVMMGVSISGCASLPGMFTQTPAEKAASAPKRIPTGAEKFANASEQLTGSLEAAAKALKAGKRDAKALEGIAEFARALPELDKGVQADFAKTRGILKKIKSADKDAIQAKVEGQYAERQKTLSGKLRTIASAESTAALKLAVTGTAKWLDDITPDAPYQPLGTELPHRIVNANAGPPVLGASIAPAYAPNLKGAEPSTLPVTPTADDTTQTIEVQFTQDISSLVTSLGADPVRMYEYVRNTIDFEPYYGSRKGANETLLEGSGNDMDTASLLIALYRKAGIPARYVSGVVDVPIAKAMNWVGVETPEAAAKLFSAGGVRTKLGYSGGRATTLRIEHTWAEAYVAYEDYRGAGAGTGPKRWVPLDASFKEYVRVASVGTAEFMPDGWTSRLASSYAENTTWQGEELAHVNLDAIKRVKSEIESAALSSMVASLSADAEARLFWSEKPMRTRVQVLPQTIPYSVRCITGEQSVPSGVERLYMRVSVGDAMNGVSVAFEGALPEYAGRRLSVVYVAAAPEDREVLRTYGGLSGAPAYLVRVRPLLVSDQVVLAWGAPVALGTSQSLSTEVVLNGVTIAQGTSGLTAPGACGICLDLGRTNRKALREAGDAFADTAGAMLAVAQGESGMTSATPAGATDGFLHAAGGWYWTVLDAFNRMTARALRTRWVRQVSVAYVSTAIGGESALGIPVTARLLGLGIDVKSDSSCHISEGPDAVARDAVFGAASGAQSSLAEGLVFPALLGLSGPSACTVAAFRAASEAGVPIVQANSGNWSAVAARLALPPEVRADIEAAVGRGCVVTTPVAPTTVGGWNGCGYIVRNPNDGSTGYMISGGMAGGQLEIAGKVAELVEWTVDWLLEHDQEFKLGAKITGKASWLVDLVPALGFLKNAMELGQCVASCATAIADISRMHLSETSQATYRAHLIGLCTANVGAIITSMSLDAMAVVVAAGSAEGGDATAAQKADMTAKIGDKLCFAIGWMTETASDKIVAMARAEEWRNPVIVYE